MGVVAAGAQPLGPRFSGTPWPEADALFHQDSRWLGADDAYSVDLGRGRVLWLFADTFVSTSPAHTRRESTMVRNSLGLERGYDPAHAAMSFYWKSAGGSPASFFAEKPGVWFWPGDGIRLGNCLIVFLMRVESTPEAGAFGFREFGWDAVRIPNPDDDPSRWILQQLDCPQNPFGVIVGSGGVMADKGFLYAFSSLEPDAHDIFLIRWSLASASAGDLRSPEWRDAGSSRWVSQKALRRLPAPVFRNGGTEFSIHFDAVTKRFLEFQTDGFGGVPIAVRDAPALTGPWSELRDGFLPPEAGRAQVFIYAGKAHPELRADGGDLVLTYATNSADLATVVDDSTLYYPRFVKLTWARR